MNYQPAMEGSDGRNLPPADATAPPWPVLARLPYVGTEEEHVARQVWRHDRVPPTQAAAPPHATAPLRIADEADDFGPLSYERVNHVESAPRPHRETRYRIDAGQPRGPVRHMAAPAVLPHDEPQTIAARVLQWHAAAAPYAGLAMTFVLAMFAGLLYWSMFPRAAAPASEPAAAPQWRANLAAAPSVSRPLWSAPAPRYDTPESPLLRTPRIQLDLPPLAELTSKSAAAEDAVAAPIDAEPALGAVRGEAEQEVADPAEKAETAEPQLTSHGDQTGPTPAAPEAAPQTLSYPTTPFASFDFGPTAHQAAAPAESPAPAETR